MKVPNAELATVEREKVVRYLLNDTHPDNGGKSAFFHALGFDRDAWSLLATALQDLVRTNEITKAVESAHGSKYIVDGRLTAPAGESRMVRSVWIVDRGSTTPRLVTAYPRDERGRI